ncbi:FIST C-terminal domain-containing protein [Viridibacillus sp. YIM B01967]|uniref:FIST C-terminal domain-containing protein n=1 Tax=Viridibacillus soli TaxID=2798301 RepID=A0ABS1H6L5_9BACL|nr:FIST N-terminal domain-containing protein [Viridibacillus soli]MBK3494787.1 FIST C-terminal domain-containing protein [Viridibacillus soli]
MELIRSNSTTHKNTAEAINQVTSKLHTEPALLLFFTSTIHKFEEVTALFHEQYPNSRVVGLTTTGEIGPFGFLENGLAAMSFSKEIGRISTVLMEDISKYPIFSRNDLVTAAKNTGINLNSQSLEKEGLAIVFPNGLIAAEEKMLSIVNSIFTNEGFPVFGGTAGDDAKFIETYVSVNGKISSNGGVVIFMKPSVDFFMLKENIFTSTGKSMKITKVDIEQRIVYELDGKKATTVYANLLGVKESQLDQYFMTNPIGRRFNDEIFIASPFQILPNGAIQFYCQVFQDAIVEILEPKNPFETLQQTLQTFTSQFVQLEGVLACNCILRKSQFQSQCLFPDLNRELEKLPNLGGFCSYGEQFNKSLVNQTLVLLGFGKKR